MHQNILEAVKRTKGLVRDKVTEYAEQSAEVYVSSVLGLEDLNIDKQRMKDIYIEEFRNLMFQQIY